MTRKIGQKFCLFEDLKGATPSVLKEKEMFSGLSLLRKPPGCMSLRYSSPLNISQMSSFFRKSLSNLYPNNLMNSASVLNKINKLYLLNLVLSLCSIVLCPPQLAELYASRGSCMPSIFVRE